MIAKYVHPQKGKEVAITDSLVALINKYSSNRIVLSTENDYFSISISPLIVFIYGVVKKIVAKDYNMSHATIAKIISSRIQK